MAKRIHLDSTTSYEGIMWFTLVIEDPINFFVEQYNDSKITPATERITHITRANLGKHWVNGFPLITLVENKLEEMGEASLLESLKSRKRQ